MKPFAYLTLSVLLLSGPVLAKHWHEDDEHGRKHGKKFRDEDRDDDRRHASARSCYFEQRDVHVLTEYYAPQYRSLPPGLQKKLYRTGHLPPGWERRIQPVPVVVERQLVALPPDYRRGFIDGYVVVYSPRTQVIIDVAAVFGH
jgi:hypothetical protein